jgi:hypothetical protein
VERGDEPESDGYRDRVGEQRLNPSYELLQRWLDQVGDGRFADPAQGQGSHGDPELASCEVVAQVLDEILRYTGTGMALGFQLVQAASTDRDDRKFGRDKETVRGYEKQDGNDAKGRGVQWFYFTWLDSFNGKLSSTSMAAGNKKETSRGLRPRKASLAAGSYAPRSGRRRLSNRATPCARTLPNFHPSRQAYPASQGWRHELRTRLSNGEGQGRHAAPPW